MGGRSLFLDAHRQDTPRARAPAGGAPRGSKVSVHVVYGGPRTFSFAAVIVFMKQKHTRASAVMLRVSSKLGCASYVWC